MHVCDVKNTFPNPVCKVHDLSDGVMMFPSICGTRDINGESIDNFMVVVGTVTGRDAVDEGKGNDVRSTRVEDIGPMEGSQFHLRITVI